MYRKFCFLLSLILFPLSVNAQDQHRFEISGGYSHMYILGEGAPGWLTNISVKRSRWIGFVLDFSGHSLEVLPNGLPGNSGRELQLKSFHFGPRVFISNRSRITPFFHGLLGLSQVASNEEERKTIGDKNSLASGAIGFGVDYRASNRLAIRLLQFDVIGVNNEMPKRKRISTAIVFRF